MYGGFSGRYSLSERLFSCKNLEICYIIPIMKKDIHAQNYRQIVFKDATNGDMFLTGSTIPTTETVKYTDGKEYPMYVVETSSTSHPFYTGQEKQLDTAGRAEKFKTRASKAGKK